MTKHLQPGSLGYLHSVISVCPSLMIQGMHKHNIKLKHCVSDVSRAILNKESRNEEKQNTCQNSFQDLFSIFSLSSLEKILARAAVQLLVKGSA